MKTKDKFRFRKQNGRKKKNTSMQSQHSEFIRQLESMNAQLFNNHNNTQKQNEN